MITLAIWVQLSEVLTEPWPGQSFATQLDALTAKLTVFGTVSLLLLATGVAGSISIRFFSMLLEPIIRWWLSRWHFRSEVRTYLRQERRNQDIFEQGGGEADFAHAVVEHESRHFANGLRWVMDWFPDRRERMDYLAKNFWLTPKQSDQVLPWMVSTINKAVDEIDRGLIPKESMREMRQRLSDDSELHNLILILEREAERDPVACVASTREKELIVEINSLIGESDFRVAISPPLAVLGLSVGIAWWSWGFVIIPLTIAIYGSALNKRKDIAELCLGRLLSDMGSCNALDQLRVWGKREAHRLIETGAVK